MNFRLKELKKNQNRPVVCSRFKDKLFFRILCKSLLLRNIKRKKRAPKAQRILFQAASAVRFDKTIRQ